MLLPLAAGDALEELLKISICHIIFICILYHIRKYQMYTYIYMYSILIMILIIYSIYTTRIYSYQKNSTIVWVHRLSRQVPGHPRSPGRSTPAFDQGAHVVCRLVTWSSQLRKIHSRSTHLEAWAIFWVRWKFINEELVVHKSTVIDCNSHTFSFPQG